MWCSQLGKNTMSIADTSSGAVDPATAPDQRISSSHGDSRRLLSSSASTETFSDAWRAQTRQLDLLKRVGLFGCDLKGAKVQRASTAEDLSAAYRLVYQVYREAGYIHAEQAEMRLRVFETSSDTATFIAKADGQVVGVISVVGDSLDLRLPSDVAFSPELDALRARGTTVCEVTNQAVAEGYRKSAVTTELMRCAVAHAIACGYRMGVATVSPSHTGFYDLLGFRLLGSERSYSDKLYDPVVALTVDFENYCVPPPNLSPASRFVHAFLGATNPYRDKVAAWDRRARVRFLNANLLERLFVTESGFLAQCSPSELDVVRLRWGQELFSAVAGALLSLPGGYSDSVSAHPFAVVSPRVTFLVRRCLTSTHLASSWLTSLPPARQRSEPAWWSWIGTVLTPKSDRRLAFGN
jgi:ribosomal protein S18 acetylase RimI-like enzyme